MEQRSIGGPRTLLALFALLLAQASFVHCDGELRAACGRGVRTGSPGGTDYQPADGGNGRTDTSEWAGDYGCASDEVEVTRSVADDSMLRLVDMANNCTSDFPPNSSNVFVNGVPLLLFNLCGAPRNEGGVRNQTAAHRTQLAFPLWTTVVVALLSLVISIVTVVGNVIVLLSFVLERTLRQATNYFIASLAVSDLLIGLFSMNLYTLYIILGDEWVLGKVVCNLWLSLDYTVCLASQYTVFFITVDRFCSVKMPAKYRNWRTDNKVLAMVLVSWIIPSLVFFVSIMGWDYFTDAPPPNPLVKTTCIAGFQNDPLFNFLLTVFYYWTTLFLMCGLYVGIYRVALNMARKAEAKQRRINTQLSANSQQPAPQTPTPVTALTTLLSAGTQPPKVEVKLSTIDEQNMASSSASESLTVRRNSRRNSKRPSVDVRRLSKIPVLEQAAEFSTYLDRPEDCDSFRKQRAGSVHSAILSTTVALLHSAQLTDCQTAVALHHACESAESHSHSNSHSRSPNANRDRDDCTPRNNTPDRLSTSSRCTCAKVQAGPGYYKSVENDVEKVDGDANNGDVASKSPTFVLRRFTMPNAQHANYALVPTCATSKPKQSRHKMDLNDVSELLPRLKDANILVASEDNDEENDRSPIWRRRPSFEERERQAKPLLANHVSPPTDRLGVEKAAPLSLSKNVQTNDRWLGNLSAPLPGSTDDQTAIGMTLLKEVNNAANHKSVDEHSVIVAAHNSESRRKSLSQLAPEDESDLSLATRKSKRSAAACSLAVRQMISVTAEKFRQKFVRGFAEICKRDKTSHKSKSQNRAKKAVRTITFILGAFVTCWTPYHIMVIISSFSPETTDSAVFNHFFRMFYWLCYLNSPINPFCYAFVNAQFKKTFIRILKLDLHVT